MSDHALPSAITLVGAGRMGSALLAGWLARGLPPQAVTVHEPAPSSALGRWTDLGLRINPTGPEPAPVVVLAIKPQSLEDATPLLARVCDADTLLISVLAGKTMGDLGARLPATRRIIRAMPNTPAAVGRGFTGCVGSAAVTAEDRAAATALLGAVGQVAWLEEEALMDAVTAVSGSGPAYVFHLVEALAAAGVAEGLPPDLAMRLARATVEGAGELLFQSPASTPSALREAVTSPGGTTAAALGVLMAPDGLTALVTRAVAAARRRAGELAG